MHTCWIPLLLCEVQSVTDRLTDLYDGHCEVYYIQGVPGECARLRENVPYVKVHRYNPKHLHPKLNGYGDNGQRSFKV